jgi:hypothetical protein
VTSHPHSGGGPRFGRLPRSAAPRSGEPGRRPAIPADTVAESLAWDLWNFRALFPGAGAAELLAVKREQDAILAREREALARLWSGDQDLLSPGHTFLEARPALAGGITVSLHTGPYQLLAEPWLAAGHDPLVLLNQRALPRFRGAVEPLSKRLRHPGTLGWAAVGEPGFMRAVVTAVRGGRPVLAYLDGNSGDDGAAGTRERGLRYALPGREILVRTGLARLACRLGCPLHRVALRWDEGRVAWDDAPSLAVGPGDDPDAVTRALFDWAFAVIGLRPAQWQYWAMLRESSACFTAARLEQPPLPPALRGDSRQAFAACCTYAPNTARLVLEHRVEVWGGEVLADLTTDRFFPAAGLSDGDLEILRCGQPTLHELREHHGDAWLRFHGLRLCLLGAARLGV